MGLGQLGPLELIIIFGVVLMFFGAKRIPEIARGLGKGIREFKSATSEISRELTVDPKPQRLYQPPAQQPIHTTTAHPQTQAAPQSQQPAVPPVGAPPPDSHGAPGQP